MDEAQDLAPSTGTTACTVSTLRLVTQARKYGLGLLFATQAPRGLHNWIPTNCTTQLYGLLNHPTQIAAARELAKAKGGDIPNIGSLGRGQFYFATERRAFREIRAPMCLSHHSGPLTEEPALASRIGWSSTIASVTITPAARGPCAGQKSERWRAGGTGMAATCSRMVTVSQEGRSDAPLLLRGPSRLPFGEGADFRIRGRRREFLYAGRLVLPPSASLLCQRLSLMSCQPPRRV
jgi:hypothetical protein